MFDFEQFENVKKEYCSLVDSILERAAEIWKLIENGPLPVSGFDDDFEIGRNLIFYYRGIDMDGDECWFEFIVPKDWFDMDDEEIRKRWKAWNKSLE